MDPQFDVAAVQRLLGVQADGELKIDAIADGLRSRSLALVGVRTLVRREQIHQRKRNR